MLLCRPEAKVPARSFRSAAGAARAAGGAPEKLTNARGRHAVFSETLRRV